ncbi:Uncharacterised protein [Mycobacteroides abscessus subsp. massiliense]|nr:Uncharacterised protein [Mycobacteroides abscessus subsp. massiliense]
MRLGLVVQIVHLTLCPCGTEDFIDDVLGDDVLGVILDADRLIDVGGAEYPMEPIDAECGGRDHQHNDERDPYPRQDLENRPFPFTRVWPGGQQLDSAYRVRLHISAIRAQISTS